MVIVLIMFGSGTKISACVCRVAQMFELQSHTRARLEKNQTCKGAVHFHQMLPYEFVHWTEPCRLSTIRPIGD